MNRDELKVGDKVLLRPLKDILCYYETDKIFCSSCLPDIPYGCNSEMKETFGQIVTIKYFLNGHGFKCTESWWTYHTDLILSKVEDR